MFKNVNIIIGFSDLMLVKVAKIDFYTTLKLIIEFKSFFTIKFCSL